MTSPKEHFVAQKVKKLINIDILKDGWPDELIFQNILQLLFHNIDKNMQMAFTAALEEATLKGEIPVRREGYHEFEYGGGGPKQKRILLIDELHYIEQSLETKDHRVDLRGREYNEGYLYECAEVAIGTRLIDSTAKFRIKFIICNRIQIDWNYKSQDIKAWLIKVDAEPGELLQAWFSATSCIKDVEEDKGIEKLVEPLEFKSFMPNFFNVYEPDSIAVAIKVEVEKFILENKRYPDKKEIWVKFQSGSSSPTPAEIKSFQKKRKIIINNFDELDYDNYRKRWDRYTCPKMDNLDNLDNLYK